MVLWGVCADIKLRIKTTGGWFSLGDGQIILRKNGVEQKAIRGYIWVHECTDATWGGALGWIPDPEYDNGRPFLTPIEALTWMLSFPMKDDRVDISSHLEDSFMKVNEQDWQKQLTEYLKVLPERDIGTETVRKFIRMYL